MDLAKNLAHWREQPPEQWIAQANRYLPSVAVVVLVILLAFQAAGLTWRLLYPSVDPADIPNVVVAPRNINTPASDSPLEALTGWFPFGRPPTPEEAEAVDAGRLIDAEETNLNLTLHLVLQAQEMPERGSTVLPEEGTAVISSGLGEQQVYQTGETIENASGAVLHSVFVDRVMLYRGNDQYERLSWPESDEIVGGGIQLNSNVTARRNQPPPPAEPRSAAELADAVGNAASVLGQHMRFEMHTENGVMVGFRLSPLGDSQIFAELGFEPGDVLTEVNGLALNDLRQASQVFNVLGETTQANVRVRRNGSDQTLVVNLGQLEQLVQSLQ